MLRDIRGFESYYAVNESGEVWSLRYGRKLSPRDNGTGYFHVHFCIKRRHSMRYVHRIVAEAFIDNPSSRKEVNHKNGLRGDNRVENLEWVTREENMQHARKSGRWVPGGGRKRKLGAETIPLIRKRYADGETQEALGKGFGVSQVTISKIIRREFWAEIP